MKEYILAIDQGTTSSRAIIFDGNAKILSKAQREFKQIYPRPGWVEHEASDILGSVMAVVAEAIVRADLTAEDISAIGITNQRETTLVWDKLTGKPIYNAIVWQCRRTAEYCEKLKNNCRDLIYEKTGLIPDAYFSATKLKWILDNVDGARARAERGELLFGTVDTFLMWHLSKGKIFATDFTNAARTMLFNIHTLRWDEELLKLFEIPRAMLPEVRPSGYVFGETDAGVFGAAVKICSAVGDQQAALYGQNCLKAGDVKNTYGTGCFLLMNTGYKAVKSENGLITSLAADCTKRPPYVLEGSVFVGGAAVQWLRDGLKIISSAEESEEVAKGVEDSAGVYVVPAFTGLGAPYWDSSARGAITGITRGTCAAHIVRATLESIAYQVDDIIRAMQKDAGLKISRLAVDGGASANNFLLQFQADISGIEVVRPEVYESTALGAALLAGRAAGIWKKYSLKEGKTFTPTLSKERRKELLDGWHKAVERTIK